MSVNAVLKESADADLAQLRQVFQEFGCSGPRADVSEIYSRPRVTAMAARMGLKPGFALDLTVVYPDDGKPWDFDCASKRTKALAKVREEKPALLIGSTMRRAFSHLQRFDFSKMSQDEVKRLLARHHAPQALHPAVSRTAEGRSLLPP